MKKRMLGSVAMLCAAVLLTLGVPIPAATPAFATSAPVYSEIFAPTPADLAGTLATKAWSASPGGSVTGSAVHWPDLLSAPFLCGAMHAPLTLSAGIDHGLTVNGVYLTGTSRYATVGAVLAYAKQHYSLPATSTAFMVSGNSPMGAALVATYSYRLGIPILVTSPTALPAVVSSQLSQYGLTHVILVGDNGVISDAVATSLTNSGRTVERWPFAPDDITGASRNVLAKARAAGWATRQDYYLAELASSPDRPSDPFAPILGGIAAGESGRALLLADNATGIDPGTVTVLKAEALAGTLHDVGVLSGGVYEGEGVVAEGSLQWGLDGDDTIAPVTILDPGASGGLAATVTVGAADGGTGIASYSYRIDGGKPTTVSAPVAGTAIVSGQATALAPRTLTISTPGTHTVTLTAVDRSGNVTAARRTAVKVAGIRSAGFSNPIAYKLKSFLSTAFTFTTDVSKVHAKLVVGMPGGSWTLFDKDVSNSAGVPYKLPAWNGKDPRTGKPAPYSASYRWTLTVTKDGRSATKTGPIILSQVYFGMSGTTAKGVASVKSAYLSGSTPPASVAFFVSASSTAPSDSLAIRVTGPGGYARVPTNSPWRIAPGASLATGRLTGTSGIRENGTYTFRMTGAKNVTYRITVIE